MATGGSSVRLASEEENEDRVRIGVFPSYRHEAGF